MMDAVNGTAHGNETIPSGIHKSTTNGYHSNVIEPCEYTGYVSNEASLSEDDPLYMFKRLGRAVYIDVNLDSIVHNINLLRNKCRNKDIGVIAVLKGDAYGHGAEPVAHHLVNCKAVDRIAVATVGEALQLRRSGIKCPIQVLGNLQCWEMQTCLLNGLIATVSCKATIDSMGQALKNLKPKQRTIEHSSSDKYAHPPQGAIHIKVDTGMGRNGCTPQQLPALVQACESNAVPLEGIFTHICFHEDEEYSRSQLELYDQLIEPYKDRNIFFHSSCSGPILMEMGTNYDFVRPGVSIYGMSPIAQIDEFAALGFRPALSIKGTPTLVKCHPKGSKVGYACTYECQSDEEWIAAFPLGFGDGFWRALGHERGCIIRDRTGERCPVVGRVSMDALTVRLPCQPDDHETFTIITADFDPVTSVQGIADAMDTISNEVLIRFAPRLPRVFRDDLGHVLSIRDALC